VAQIRPPWASMIERQIDSPMPMPSGGRVECVEQAVEAPRRQSRPGISHRDKHAVHSIARTADQQLPRRFVRCAHCFNGVDDQVQPHLLQLDAIRLHHRQLLRQLDLQRDVMPEQLAPGQAGGVEDRLVDIQRVVPWWHLFDEAANPADDLTRSLAVLHDIAEGLPDLAEVRRLGAKPTQGGDRLSDFVGDRGREVPHGGDAVGVRKRHRALFLGFEQPHVFDRDHRLIGEGLEKRDLLVAEGSDFHSPYQNYSNGDPLAQQRRRKCGPMALAFRVPAAYRVLAVLCDEVMDMNRPTFACGSSNHRVSVSRSSLAGMASRRNFPV
jgi:hypothetical protein